MTDDEITKQMKSIKDAKLSDEEKDALIKALWKYILSFYSPDEPWNELTEKIGISGEQLYFLRTKYEEP